MIATEETVKVENKLKIRALKKYVIENNIEKVRDLISTISIPDFIDNISDWTNAEIIALTEILDPKINSKILYNLPSKNIKLLIQSLSLTELKAIFEELYVDEIVDILEGQTKAISSKVYSVLSKQTNEKVNSYLKYSKSTAGYNMSIEFIKIFEDSDVKTALEEIKDQVSNDELEIIGYIYVVDSNNNLKGFVRPEILIVAPLNEQISKYIEEIPSIGVNSELSEVKNKIAKYEKSFLPVVNDLNKLVGVIGAEDFLDSIQIIEDGDILEGTRVSSKPYSQQSIFDLFKSRVGWIIALLVIGSITQIMIIGFQLIWQSAGIWTYNDASNASGLIVSSIITLALTTALSVASSINDASGNSGSQTSSTLIRAIATKDIDRTQYGMVIRKETYAGVLIGLAVSLTSMLRMWMIWGLMGQLNDITTFEFTWYFVISLIASISFFFAIVVGNFVGAILPMISLKFGKDPALLSGPLQTTVVDIITFFIYLSLTTLVFVLAKDHINSLDPDINNEVKTSITCLSCLKDFQFKIQF